MKQRIIGFDVARAYAIFGMFIVNFNFCFGQLADPSPAGRFLALFVGNSTAIFIVLAGMGVSLMVRSAAGDAVKRATFKNIILKRSWFLLALGLVLFSWWPGDILHFYGGYMHIAAFMLFIGRRYYLWTAAIVLVAYHLLLLLIPVETSWDMGSYKYADFWTVQGFLRNTLYNGWNSIFPWFTYFVTGMWLGRLNWEKRSTLKQVFITGLLLFLVFRGLRIVAGYELFSSYWTFYIMIEYFPPYLPFMMITLGFALMVLPVCFRIAELAPRSKILLALAATGRMTLSLYVLHVTLGMLILSRLSGLPYTGYLQPHKPLPPLYVLGFATSFYILSMLFCTLWSRKFKHGPLETLMRRISG